MCVASAGGPARRGRTVPAFQPMFQDLGGTGRPGFDAANAQDVTQRLRAVQGLPQPEPGADLAPGGATGGSPNLSPQGSSSLTAPQQTSITQGALARRRQRRG